MHAVQVPFALLPGARASCLALRCPAVPGGLCCSAGADCDRRGLVYKQPMASCLGCPGATRVSALYQNLPVALTPAESVSGCIARHNLEGSNTTCRHQCNECSSKPWNCPPTALASPSQTSHSQRSTDPNSPILAGRILECRGSRMTAVPARPTHHATRDRDRIHHQSLYQPQTAIVGVMVCWS